MESLLLAWYSRFGRDLPWRRTTDPYAILVSEVMLQQTQVDRVIPRYLAWLERWPTVDALAAASAADVIRAWQGLGYNRRALALHRAAQAIAARRLARRSDRAPGRRPVHRAAVRNFAFGEDVLPHDVNVDRVERRTGPRLHRRSRAGADGPRRHRLPRPHPALRRVPARGRLPVARHPRRAGPEAGPVRGVVPAAACGHAAARRGGAGRP